MLPIDASWAVTLAVIGGGLTLLLGVVFLFAPQRGLRMTRHHAEDLPLIMAGRYFFMTLIAFAAAYSASPVTIGVVFIGLAGVALFDAAVYFRAGKPVAPHIGAGVGALAVAGVALWGQG